MQEIITVKDKEASDIDAYPEQLEERISNFELGILSLKRAIQLSAEDGGIKNKRRNFKDNLNSSSS